jgi:hypothetical protein
MKSQKKSKPKESEEDESVIIKKICLNKETSMEIVAKKLKRFNQNVEDIKNSCFKDIFKTFKESAFTDFDAFIEKTCCLKNK